MGLLLEFPRKPGQKHRRHVTTPLRPEQRTGRRVPQTACGHRLFLGVVPIVSIRVEGGYAARCLLCGTTGPVRGSGEAARSYLYS
jgi:hypothetical protein